MAAAALRAQLAPAQDPGSEEVKAQLKTTTSRAIAAGVFGVPAMLVDDKVFWGQDALPMLRDYLQGGAWFQGSDWEQCSALPKTLERKRS
jgi:2-hydroxychromene-2-carboxylate isomerase